MNVDVKIGSEVIAKRLENVLPHIIHYDQNAFVKGRLIFDACVVRTISNDNRTEWSSIRSVIIRVITKSDDRAAGARFV